MINLIKWGRQKWPDAKEINIIDVELNNSAYCIVEYSVGYGNMLLLNPPIPEYIIWRVEFFLHRALDGETWWKTGGIKRMDRS